MSSSDDTLQTLMSETHGTSENRNEILVNLAASGSVATVRLGVPKGCSLFHRLRFMTIMASRHLGLRRVSNVNNSVLPQF